MSADAFDQTDSTKLAVAADFKMASVPLPPVQPILTVAQKQAKDKLENPTVDENGEHITTVAEAKIEAQAMQ